MPTRAIVSLSRIPILVSSLMWDVGVFVCKLDGEREKGFVISGSGFKNWREAG